VKPLVLDPAHLDNPLAVEGTAWGANSKPAAGLIVFALDDSEVEFEIYPLDGKSVTLEDVVVRFDDDSVELGE
jgi:hypothetical protein